MIKNKTGDSIGYIDNCSEDVVNLYGRKEIDHIQHEEKMARESAEREPYYPYESNIRVFMIDNNKNPVYCCAIVYDMPHRIKAEPNNKEIGRANLWDSLMNNHPTKLVNTVYREKYRPANTCKVCS